MRSISTFSILFWTYKSRKDKNDQTQIYARITFNGTKVNLSLKEKVPIDSWDSKRQRARGNGVNSRRINHYLDVVKSDLVQCFRELKRGERILTANLIKARYLGEDKEFQSLLDLFEFHNKEMGSKLADKTLCHYRTSQKYILEFVKSKFRKSDMYLKDLDYAFVLSFENYLRKYRPKHYQGSIGNNAVMKHIQRLRKMVTLAYHMEWIDRDPFVKFKPKLEKREREFLTEAELKKIESLQSPIERLSIVKDLFIFSCYTGISYGDIMKLSKENLMEGIDGSSWIMANRNKTGTPFKIPLLPTTEMLIKKYEYHPRTFHGNTLLPKISNQRLNSYLKEIADLCGIDKNLTFHMARHTFATTVTLTNGVPIETVSKLLGHTKLATTQIYARVLDKKISDDMNMLKKKLNPTKKVGGNDVSP